MRKIIRKLILESAPDLNLWLQKTGDEARKRGITDFHIVATDPNHPLGGGSYHYTSGQDSISPVKRIRKIMIDWENEMGFDPDHDWRSEDIRLYSFVPEKDIESVKKWGLAGTRGIIQNPGLLRSLFPNRKARQSWVSKYDKKDITLQGPSILFQIVPRDFIISLDSHHLLSKGKYRLIEIKWSEFKRDNPGAYIMGLELVPYEDEEYEEMKSQIERELSDDEVFKLCQKSYQETWKDYVPGFFAGNVPHGIIMCESGIVEPKYLNFNVS